MPVPYWRLSGFYFFYFATLGTLVPFWSLYLKNDGFNAAQIGVLTALLQATKVIAPHLWGWLADRSGHYLLLIRITSLLALLLFSGFFYRHDYIWVAGVTVAFSLFWNAVLPQFEAATLRHLKTEPQRYARIRLWGSIGFIIAVLGIGGLLDAFDIAYLPWVIAGLLAFNWLAALATPNAGQQTTVKVEQSIWRVLVKPEILAFFSVYMLLQVAHGPYYAFYSVYLQQYGYSATETGMLWALGVVAEIGIFVWIQNLLRRVGLRALLLTSLALSAGRWWVIGYGAEHQALIWSAQLLHAASFGIAHVVAVQLLHRYFGERHQSKGQALYSSISFGLGGMIGSFGSGYFWDSLGGGAVFTIAAWICGLAWLIAFIGVARQNSAALG